MSGELILIVEDNEKNRKLVRDVLQVKGYQTLETETAEEGHAFAVEKHPALILMDIQLPGMDGITALKRLRADPMTKSIPVMPYPNHRKAKCLGGKAVDASPGGIRRRLARLVYGLS